MIVIDKIREGINKINWRQSEKWLTVAYLGFQLLLMFTNPTASMAMGIFLISVLLAANSF